MKRRLATVLRRLADRLHPPRTGTVVAKMSGNATRELPGVATALGPLHVGRGRLAEYAVDGNLRGKKLAELLARMADDIDAEFKAHADAAERLAEELGEDDAREAAAALRNAGLTYAEIIADAEAIAAAWKRLRGDEAA